MVPFPRLQALFANFSHTYARICDDDGHGLERRRAEMLLDRAAVMDITGVEKIATDSGSLSKFINLLAELRFALLFAHVGGRVEILPDAAFGIGYYTPDLRVTFPDRLVFLVEVIRGSSGSPDLMEDLDAALKREGIPFRVTDLLGVRLSAAAPDGRTRQENEALCKRVVHEATVGLLAAHSKGLTDGVVHVRAVDSDLRHELRGGRPQRLPLEEDVPCRPGETWVASFVFEPSTLATGYAAGGVTSGHFLDENRQRARFLRDLQNKASKRQKLPPEYASIPYLVAVQNDEHELTTISVLSALTGSRQAFPDSAFEPAKRLQEHPIARPEPVISAARSGWGPVLEAWDYDSNVEVRFTDDGAYLDHRWAKELSGVIVAHGGWLLQWLPNPFATAEINDPRILRIGLPLNKLGTMAPEETGWPF
ncbi:hypothetical protein [Sorangium cellulosum]|uniref:hypothetical protein n=1 Tax=Sorangium cellulosum TaxID=56 RepID=UPI0011DD92A0|nr:hypothetical protein [Sorangium cellulosum]